MNEIIEALVRIRSLKNSVKIALRRNRADYHKTRAAVGESL